VATSNNRVHLTRSLYYCLFAPHIWCSSCTFRSWWTAQRQPIGCNRIICWSQENPTNKLKQQSSGFFNELKTTPLIEYFRPIILYNISSTYSTAVFCKEMKIPPWSTLQQLKAWKKKWSESQITNIFVRSVGASLQATIHIIIVYGFWLKKAEKLAKRQTIFFKHIVCKKSLNCTEKSLGMAPVSRRNPASRLKTSVARWLSPNSTCYCKLYHGKLLDPAKNHYHGTNIQLKPAENSEILLRETGIFEVFKIYF